MIGRYVSGAVILLFFAFVLWSIVLFIGIFGHKFVIGLMEGWGNAEDQVTIRLAAGSFLIVLDIVLVLALFVMIGDSRERRKKKQRSLEDRIEELEGQLDKSRKIDPHHDPLR